MRVQPLKDDRETVRGWYNCTYAQVVQAKAGRLVDLALVEIVLAEVESRVNDVQVVLRLQHGGVVDSNTFNELILDHSYLCPGVSVIGARREVQMRSARSAAGLPALVIVEGHDQQ